MLFPNVVDVPIYRCIEDKNIVFIQKMWDLYHEILVRIIGWHIICINQTASKSMLEKLLIIVGGQTHRIFHI